MWTDTLVNGFGIHDSGLAVLRVSTGVFFAISGYHKLFNKARHQSLVETLVADRVPMVKFNQWFVPVVELGAGIALSAGIFSVVSAALLAFVCFVATCVDGWKRVKEYQPIDAADVVDDILYLPEVLLMLMLITIILGGPGDLSIDSILWK